MPWNDGQTFVVGNVWVDVVLNDESHDVITPHLTGVAQSCSAGRVTEIHVGTLTQQQLERFTASLLFLHRQKDRPTPLIMA